MSPTSYRTAPPRTLIVTTTAHRVKPRRMAAAGRRAFGRDFSMQRVEWMRASAAPRRSNHPFCMLLAKHSAAKGLRLRLLEPLLHLGFALTGVGTVLLGSILPRLSAQWHLRDKDAGLLLLVQFAMSASGALLVRRNFCKTLTLGYALIGGGAFAIFLLQQKSLPAFAVYGLGLGLAMTSTSMLTSRRYPKRMGAALALLNLSWSAGSVACPLLAAQLLRHALSSTAFALVGLMALPFALLPLLRDLDDLDVPASPAPAPARRREAATIVYFAFLAFLYVGIEATVGNWMSTYASRTMAWKFAGSSLAVAVFWAALLLGRALTPVMLIRMPEQRLYRAAVFATIAGVFLLLSAHTPLAILSGSALTGLALAPLFPLILALFLEEVGGSNNAGWVFGLAGLGGAVLSWLTGVVSTGTGSLRIGLLVPGFAALVMLWMIGWRRASSKPEANMLQPTISGKI
jgi:MFS transporter, FHS family, glucose/mannose:H+ symporter